MMSITEMARIQKKRYSEILGVDSYEVEDILDDPVIVYDTRIWFNFLWIKLTETYESRFYPKIIRWKDEFGDFYMRFEPEIKYNKTKHEKIHYEDDQTSLEFVKRKIDEHKKGDKHEER